MATNPQDEFPATDPDASAAPSGVGAALRSARERTGKDVAEVAKLLRIRQPFLQALEEGRHKDLPGGTYAIGFLRTYAEFLELDGEEMVRQFKMEAAADLHSRSELVFPSPVSEGRIPNGGLLLIGLMVAAVAYGGWYWLNARNATIAGSPAALPERLLSEFSRPASLTADKAKSDEATAKPADTPVAAAGDDQAKATDKVKDDVVPPAEEDPAAKPGDTQAAAPEAQNAEPAKPEIPQTDAAKTEPAKTEPAKTEPAKIEPVKTDPVKPADKAKGDATKPADKPKDAKADSTKQDGPKPDAVKADTAKSDAAKSDVAKADSGKADPAKIATAAPAPAAPAETASVPAAPEASGSRVSIKAAADDCWIQVREMDGQLLVSKLLRRGDSFPIPDRPGLTLTVGNAGALEIAVDGKPVPSLGGVGQVRRDISLDPAKLLPGQ